VLGLAWRLYVVLGRPARADYSEPRRSDLVAGAMRTIFAKMLPPRGVKVRGVAMANAYLYHAGLALVAFGFAPHIRFIERYTGIGWPALPDPVMYVASGVAIVGLVIALIDRLSDRVLRLLSGFDDYFSWAVVMLPLLTGMALIDRPYQPAPQAATPVSPGLLAIHLLSLELLLVWLPFGKLAHAALVFVSRWRTGADFTRKGAAI